MTTNIYDLPPLTPEDYPKQPAMTDQEKNVKIAEKCGWTKVGEKGFGSRAMVGCRPGESYWAFTPIPDFFGDDRACREMRKVLTPEQRERFSHELLKRLEKKNKGAWVSLFDAADATPELQTECFNLCFTPNLW